MSNVFCIFFMIEIIVVINAEDNCEFGQEQLNVSFLSNCLFKTFDSSKNKSNILQYLCRMNETFVAENRACVKNNFLVKMNSKYKCYDPVSLFHIDVFFIFSSFFFFFFIIIIIMIMMINEKAVIRRNNLNNIKG